MWVAQRAVYHQVHEGGFFSPEQVLCDTLPAPCLAPGRPLLLAYADNLNVVATNPEGAGQARDQFKDHFEATCFKMHELAGPSLEVTSLGYRICGAQRLVCPTAEKWKNA